MIHANGVTPMNPIDCGIPKHSINLGKFHHDRTLFSRALESWFILGKSSPFMAARFRLVTYYNLPRSLVGALEPWNFIGIL